MTRVAKWTAHAVAAVAACAILLSSGNALAQANKADLTVYEIRASNEKGPSDPELTKGVLGKKLKKGPFRSWTRFQKLARHQKQIQQLKANVSKLVPGGNVSVLMRSRSQAKGKKDRVRMSLTMDSKAGKRTLDTTIELDAGEYFLVGGQQLEGGATFILAISVK